nr:AAA family ATPase [Bradyrhizobium sp. SZCCHNR1075]
MREDRFGSWEEYIAAIEADTEIAALGITDYLSVKNYAYARELKDAGRLQNVALIFPNIEFRITPATRHGKGINLHLLVSPDDPDHVTQIEEALGQLSFEYTTEKKFYCTEASLIALGRALTDKQTDATAALKEGVNQFKVEFRQFRDWYRSQPWLSRNALIALDAGQQDGAAGLQHDDGFRAVREELYSFADVIFSPRPKDRLFWLGKSHGPDALKRLGGPKPCLHGCDAHSMDRLLKPDEGRHCWIKADPTFEGLRQVIFEPEERVWIGESPPDLHDRSRTLQSVTVLNSKGWFEEVELPLNPGLVSIIGKKGMGKSALNELIAFAGRDWTDEPGSFISRARASLRGTKVVLNWCDGSTSITEITAKGTSEGTKQVRYLSQKFVERLCAHPTGDSDLVREIEAIVFNHLPPSETLNASNFADLRDKRTATTRKEKARLISEIKKLHREIDEGFKKQLSLPNRLARRQDLNQAIAALLKQMPSLESPAEEEAAQRLGQEQKALSEAVALQANFKDKLLQIELVQQKIKTFQTEMNRFSFDLLEDLRSIGVPDADLDSFVPCFPGDVTTPITQRFQHFNRRIAELEGDESEPAPGTIRFRWQRVTEMRDRVMADQAKQKRYVEINQSISDIHQEIHRMDAEIESIKGPELTKLNTMRDRRRAVYVEYFEALKLEQKALAELYRPLQQQFAGHEEEKKVQFHIQWHVDIDAWIERGMNLFDQRKARPYSSIEQMKEAAQTHLLSGWLGSTADSIKSGLDNFLEPFPQQGEAIQSILRSNYSVADFFDWIYSVDHISLAYGLSYQGTALENLSPGTKGIVLLMLYLAMDSKDNRPLLIDQPDENLDNDSIYSLLANYFRRAKERRQILLITHNPNLVVNTDAEQIVVAECVKDDRGTPRFTYLSGAIEDTRSEGARETACLILEGGGTAFMRRERRYALKRADIWSDLRNHAAPKESDSA